MSIAIFAQVHKVGMTEDAIEQEVGMTEDEVDYHYPIRTAGQWQSGLCVNCFTRHRALVMLCTHCRIGCCDDSVCDPCHNCGLPFCNVVSELIILANSMFW